MRRPPHGATWVLAALAVLGALLVGLLRPAADPWTAAGAAILTATAAGATWHVTRRDDLTVLAAATLAPWRLLHDAALPVQGAALLLALLLLWTPHRPAATAAAAAAAAGTAALLVHGNAPLPLAIAVAAAGLLSLLRPRRPTQDALAAFRTAALFLPGLAVVALLALNAATGRWEDRAGPDAILLGLGLLGLLGLLALALLGLSLLMETTDVAQRHAWTALAAAAGLALAGLNPRPEPLILLTVAAAVPLGTLAAITAARLRAVAVRHAWTAYLLPPAAVLLQLGFTP